MLQEHGMHAISIGNNEIHEYELVSSEGFRGEKPDLNTSYGSLP